MKKRLLVLITGAMLISLAGCSNTASVDNQEETTRETNSAVVVETTIEEKTTEVETTTVAEPTTKKKPKVAQPSKLSKCKTPQEAIKPVCKGFEDRDIDEMFSTFPSDLMEYSAMKDVKRDAQDVLKQLEEVEDSGVSYQITIGDVGNPVKADMDEINNEFAALGVDFRITKLKKVTLVATVSAEGQTMQQDILDCVAGKIGKYWYFVSVDL